MNRKSCCSVCPFEGTTKQVQRHYDNRHTATINLSLEVVRAGLSKLASTVIIHIEGSRVIPLKLPLPDGKLDKVVVHGEWKA
jgi:hypothetical protein